MKNRKLIIVLLLILIVALGILYYLELRTSHQTNEEKNALAQDLSTLLVEYQALETNNDSMNNQITEKQEIIENMLEEIKKTKAINRAAIRQYKEELGTLREVMRSYIVQIDSLNTLNQTLTAENVKIKNRYIVEQERTESLSKQNERLSDIISQASILEAMNIHAIGVNNKNKPQKRARNTDKIKVCFTLNTNITAPKGDRNIYIQIIDPKNKTLTKDPNNKITIDNESVPYSDYRTVNYEGNLLDVCIYYNIQGGELSKGVYKVSIYSDGSKIGSSGFELK